MIKKSDITVRTWTSAERAARGMKQGMPGCVLAVAQVVVSGMQHAEEEMLKHDRTDALKRAKEDAREVVWRILYEDVATAVRELQRAVQMKVGPEYGYEARELDRRFEELGKMLRGSDSR